MLLVTIDGHSAESEASQGLIPTKILQGSGEAVCFFYVFVLSCLLCICALLFICALWSPAGKGLTSWLSFVVSNCEFVTFPLVSWVRCGT